MTVSLQKGGNINLNKSAPGVTQLVIGLGWDVRATDGKPFDLDSTAFLLKNGKVRSDQDFIFYRNLKSPCGSVVHNGDNLTGSGSGDDETITFDLLRVPADVDRIAICVTIHEGDVNGQNFGQVGNAYIRCVNPVDGVEIARYDLSEDSSTETAMVFGELYLHNGEWKFRAVGQGFAAGLAALATAFGVNVG